MFRDMARDLTWYLCVSLSPTQICTPAWCVYSLSLHIVFAQNVLWYCTQSIFLMFKSFTEYWHCYAYDVVCIMIMVQQIIIRALPRLQWVEAKWHTLVTKICFSFFLTDEVLFLCIINIVLVLLRYKLIYNYCASWILGDLKMMVLLK